MNSDVDEDEDCRDDDAVKSDDKESTVEESTIGEEYQFFAYRTREELNYLASISEAFSQYNLSELSAQNFMNNSDKQHLRQQAFYIGNKETKTTGHDVVGYHQRHDGPKIQEMLQCCCCTKLINFCELC